METPSGADKQSNPCPREHKHRNYGDCSVAVGVNLCFFFSFFFPLLGWTDSGTDGLVCCVTVCLFFFYFPLPPARPSTAKITSRHLCFTEPSDLAADYLYFLSRCELASVIVSQVSAKRRRPHLRTGDASDVKSRAPSLFIQPQNHIAAVALPDHNKIKGEDALFSRK